MSTVNQLMGRFSSSQRSRHFTFKADKLDSATFKVIDFSVDEGLSCPFVVKLSLASAQNDFDEQVLVDQSGVLTLYRNDVAERCFHGVVFSLTQGNTGRHHTFYEIVLVPEFSRLMLRTNARIFQGRNVVEIAEVLLAEMNISHYALAIRHNHSAREYCVQYSESDFDFIERLFAEEGIFYYFEHEPDRHTLVIADDNSVTHALAFPCRYNNTEGGLAADSCIRSLTQRSQMAPTDAVLQDYSFKQPSHSFLNRAHGTNTARQRHYEHYMYPGRFKDDAIGQAFSNTRIDYLRRDAETLQGQGDIAETAAGIQISIGDHERIAEGDSWLVTQVRHEGSQPQSLDNEGSEGMTTYHNTFAALPYRHPWKPRPEVKPRIYGAHMAKVVGPEDEEIYCDEYGRVKVQFPWDRYGQSNQDSSCWIRVAQNWAGSAWGHIAVPRIGQEVMVTFLEGDPDQPMITGRTYDAIHPTPYKLPALKIHSAIKSKEHKGCGYSEFLLDDTSGEIKTKLHTTHAATQLTMGYLTHPRKQDGRGAYRGDGFELRTDSWGAIRTGKGLYISSDKREKAEGKQLDLEEAIGQLQSALDVAINLASSAKVAGAESADIQALQSQLETVYEDLQQPGILASAPKGIAAVTPSHAQISAGRNITLTASQHADISAMKDYRVAAGEGISLLAVEKTMKLIANQGQVDLQAQHNAMNINAEKNLIMTSSKGTITVAAEEELVLTCGGAYIKLKDGKIELGGSNQLEVKMSAYNFMGPEQLDYAMPQFNVEGNHHLRFHFADDDQQPYVHKKYIAYLPDGREITGTTDHEGYTQMFYTDEEEEIKVHLQLNEASC